LYSKDKITQEVLESIKDKKDLEWYVDYVNIYHDELENYLPILKIDD